MRLRRIGQGGGPLVRAAALGEMTRHLKLGGYGLRAESPRGSKASAPPFSHSQVVCR